LGSTPFKLFYDNPSTMRGLFILAALPAVRAHSCSDGNRVTCMAVQSFSIEDTGRTGKEASGQPLCTPFGDKVYCLPEHNYHECDDGYSPCCADGSSPNHHNHYEHHDAVTCSQAATSFLEPIVLDDMDFQGRTRNPNTYEGDFQACMVDAYNGQFHHDWAKNKGSASMSYTFDPPNDGCYKIEEYHPGSDDACSQYMPTNAELQVDYCKGLTATFSINQAAQPAQWNTVANLMFYQGNQGKLIMRNSAGEQCRAGAGNCFMMADAFRVTWLGARCPMGEAVQNPEAQAAAAVDAAVQGHAEHGDLYLTVQNNEGTDEEAELIRQHGRVEVTLAAHLGYQSVGIMAFIEQSRRLQGSNQMMSVSTSTFHVPFLAKGETGNKHPGTLVDLLNSMLESSPSNMKVLSTSVEWKALPGYSHIAPGCVKGQNIQLYADKTVDECAVLCNALDECLAFEYGVDYGGSGQLQTWGYGVDYVVRDCQLQSGTDTAGCDGSFNNLDLYVKAVGGVYKYILIAAAALALSVMVLTSIAMYVCCKRCKRQTPKQEEKEDVVNVVAVAEKDLENDAEKAWESHSGSTEEPASDEGKSESSSAKDQNNNDVSPEKETGVEV